MEQVTIENTFRLLPSTKVKIFNFYLFSDTLKESSKGMFSAGDRGSLAGASNPQGAKEEPSIGADWMEKLATVNIPRAAMNKLVMNYLVTEGFKVAQWQSTFTK